MLILRNIKTPNLEKKCSLFILSSLPKFSWKIVIFFTFRSLSVCFIRVFQFSIFWTVGESTDFLLKLKVDIVKAKLSTMEHLQFYLLKHPYSKLLVMKNLKRFNVNGFKIYASIYTLKFNQNKSSLFHRLTGVTTKQGCRHTITI